jgi:hypothetical protein
MMSPLLHQSSWVVAQPSQCGSFLANEEAANMRVATMAEIVRYFISMVVLSLEVLIVVQPESII